jgi:hypothetical protein
MEGQRQLHLDGLYPLRPQAHRAGLGYPSDVARLPSTTGRNPEVPPGAAGVRRRLAEDGPDVAGLRREQPVFRQGAPRFGQPPPDTGQSQPQSRQSWRVPGRSSRESRCACRLPAEGSGTSSSARGTLAGVGGTA